MGLLYVHLKTVITKRLRSLSYPAPFIDALDKPKTTSDMKHDPIATLANVHRSTETANWLIF